MNAASFVELVMIVTSALTSSSQIQQEIPELPQIAITEKIVEECGCKAFVISTAVIPFHSYKLISTTDLNGRWIDEFAPITTLTNKMSWAIGTESIGNKFFRVVDMGLGGYITTRLNELSIPSSYILVSEDYTFEDFELIAYDIKSHVTSSLLESAMITIIADSPTSDISSIFSAVKLRIGELTYTGNVIISRTNSLIENGYEWVIQFDDMAIPLPPDTYIPIRVTADIIPNQEGKLDSVQIIAGYGGIGLSVIDANHTSNLGSEIGPTQGTGFTTVSINPIIINPRSTVDSPILINDKITGYNVSFSFTVVSGVKDLFISKDSIALDTETTGNPELTIDSLHATPEVLSADAIQYYFIPAGSVRQFTYTGIVSQNNAVGIKTASIKGIRYGTSPTNLTEHIFTKKLKELKVITSF